MNVNLIETDTIRRSNSDDIKSVWECIRNIRIQKQIAVLDKLIKNISRDVNINEEAAKRMILNVEYDGLIERCNNQSTTGLANVPFSNEFFTLPDFSKQYIKGSNDWNCFSCHLAGEVISCSTCCRSYHINCYKEFKQNLAQPFNRFPKNSDKLLCPSCELKSESSECFSRKQVRKLLDFATHFIRKKSIWKDMATIGFRGEITKNEYLVHRYLDLDLIQRKIKDGRYVVLQDLVEDTEVFVHDVCILHGIFSDKADQARVLLREIRDEVREVQLCADCYINAKAKLAEWITKPCKPPHKLIWARQTGSPGGQFFWPAKLLADKSDGFEVRFFGGVHDRAFIKKSDTKSFNFRPDEVEIKAGSGFDRAWNEVTKLREKVEQGYYTQSSGESDLPSTEDEYSDEIYLCERRSAGLTLTDNTTLANGGSYPLFNSLSSRRSTAIESSKGSPTRLPAVKFRKSALSPSPPLVVKAVAKKRRASGGALGAPRAKRRISGNDVTKSAPSKTRGHGHSSDGAGDDNDSEISSSSSSSINMKSLNYQFSPKTPNIRSPLAAAKGLRQNRKPSTKMSQLSSSGRYTSLSDRIKMDLSSTDSSEFDPKQEKIGFKKKRGRKPKYKLAPASTGNKQATRSPGMSKQVDSMPPSLSSQHAIKPAIHTRSHSSSSTSTSSNGDDKESSAGGNEDTERCCSPDHLPTPSLFRSISTAINNNTNNRQRPARATPVVQGPAKHTADSTSNHTTVGVSTALTVTTAFNPPPVVMAAPPKRMVHKCVNTNMPPCNCQEKFEKKLEEEQQKLSKEHAQMMIELEMKLKAEFEESKSIAIKMATEELRLQMQELIDKERMLSQEALAAVEAKHNEALTNTKRRQWCRNCIKEAIYHCCWNTSYCSIQCQQEHWQKEHKRICRRKR